jgi:hypothetical protein
MTVVEDQHDLKSSTLHTALLGKGAKTGSDAILLVAGRHNHNGTQPLLRDLRDH